MRAYVERLRQAAGVLAGTPRVLRLVWRAQPAYAAALAGIAVLQGLTPAVLGLLNKNLMDAVAASLFGEASGGEVAGAAIFGLFALWAGYAVARSTLNPLQELVREQLGDYVTRDVNLLVLDKANSLKDITFFESPRFHDLLQKARNDIQWRPLNITTGVTWLAQQVIAFTSMLAILAVFSAPLALLLVACALPNLILQFKHRRAMWSINNWSVPDVRRMQYLRRILTDKAEAKETRVFGLGGYFLGEYQRTFDAYHGRLGQERVRHWSGALALAVVSAGATMAGYGAVALSAITGAITLGDFLLYTAALYVVRDNLYAMVWQVSSLYEGNLFIRNLFEFLDLPLTMKEPAARAPAPRPLREGIELRGVGFKYEGRDAPVLEDVSFSIPVGKTVALVGENGAGKTTLVKLLTRLRDPSSGEVLVDGRDLREIDVGDWRAQIGVVFQDFTRFSLPAHENIALGDLARYQDREAVRTAASAGGAASLVERLPDGYDTMLGRRFSAVGNDGVDLSGGEWQRVALSRGFMRRDAQLLILDEPTAALDARAEHEIYLRFKELTRGRSTLLISHRFSTVRMADHIVVLDGGRIVEQGSHEALVAAGGMYARLYAMQAEWYV